MRLLCVAAKAEPYGYVCVNGRSLDSTDMAKLAGVSEDQVTGLLMELDRNGVFSRDRKGRMYCRRMVREAQRRAVNRKNGQKGGNPTLSDERGNSGSDNPPDKPPDKARGLEVKRESKDSCRAREANIASEFDEQFWPAYPSKVGRKPAKAAFIKARKQNDLQTILDGLERYKRSKPADRQWLNPSTFLNQERWNDEESSNVTPIGATALRQRMREAERRGDHNTYWECKRLLGEVKTAREG